MKWQTVTNRDRLRVEVGRKQAGDGCRYKKGTERVLVGLELCLDWLNKQTLKSPVPVTPETHNNF